MCDTGPLQRHVCDALQLGSFWQIMFIIKMQKNKKQKQNKTKIKRRWEYTKGRDQCSNLYSNTTMIINIHKKNHNPQLSSRSTINAPPSVLPTTTGYILHTRYTRNTIYTIAACNGWVNYKSPMYHITCIYIQNNPRYITHTNTKKALSAER
ncbi:Uncharacterised protein [Chlamydia trachomatis]|nr:Uncharacterised protein [Chlamydia trachomatis]